MQYAKMPEMRVVWIFAVLFLAMAIIDFFYLPPIWGLIGLVILIGAAILLFTGSLKTASSNFELKNEHQMLDTVITGLEDAVIVHDNEFTIHIFNKAAAALFRIPQEEMVGKKFALESANQNAQHKLLSQVLFPSLAPVIIKRSDPGTYPQIVDIVFEQSFMQLRVATMPMTDKNGQQTGVIKVIHDRTREMNLLKAKSEFVTITSHQLRTPLTAVNWAFQELQQAGVSDQERIELTQTGAMAAQKLSRIVNDFLDVAKIEEGRFGYNYQNADLIEFTRKVVEEAAPIAKQYKVNVYFEKPATPIIVSIDQAKMGIVFSNLIDNAIKYNVENGQVVVSIHQIVSKPFVEVVIKDTGVGITPEEIKKLFTKFFRTEAAIKLDATGSGLGLYLVKNIIEQHGGEIWAQSVVGRGTEFHFTIPTDPSLVPQKEVGAYEAE